MQRSIAVRRLEKKRERERKSASSLDDRDALPAEMERALVRWSLSS